jgi:hypothetical protein
MTVFYDLAGRPVASIDGDAVYDAHGRQVAILSESNLFAIGPHDNRDGDPWTGFLSAGVVYNFRDEPQAFSIGCKKGLRPLRPRLAPMPPRISSRGSDISDLASVDVPDFLRSPN